MNQTPRSRRTLLLAGAACTPVEPAKTDPKKVDATKKVDKPEVKVPAKADPKKARELVDELKNSRGKGGKVNTRERVAALCARFPIYEG